MTRRDFWQLFGRGLSALGAGIVGAKMMTADFTTGRSCDPGKRYEPGRLLLCETRLDKRPIRVKRKRITVTDDWD